MGDQEIIDAVIAFVKDTLKGAEGGHDWFHIERVYNTAKQIVKDEDGADHLIVSLGALLHDIADAKFNDGDETIGPKIAQNFLISLKLDGKLINRVIDIIENISFKNSLSGKAESRPSKELQIVRDADRLDAMGAIGIARAFNYGGFKNRELYNPDIKPNLNLTKEEYKKSTAPTLNHFYEKLLLLKDGMHTETGKELALERHRYMLGFLEQFYREWKGHS